jgi:hypothetical protein
MRSMGEQQLKYTVLSPIIYLGMQVYAIILQTQQFIFALSLTVCKSKKNIQF